MTRSFKLNPETMEESYQVKHVGNARKKLAHEKEVIRRAIKRGVRQLEVKELEAEVYNAQDD